MEKICLGGKTFSLKIIKKPISSIRLRLTKKREISISVPLLTPQIFIKSFIQKNSQ